MGAPLMWDPHELGVSVSTEASDGLSSQSVRVSWNSPRDPYLRTYHRGMIWQVFASCPLAGPLLSQDFLSWRPPGLMGSTLGQLLEQLRPPRSFSNFVAFLTSMYVYELQGFTASE